MKKSMSAVLAAFCLVVSSPAFALTILKGDEAARHVGDAKAKFTSALYTYEILKRSHRDAMHGRFSDAVIFNAGGGLFSYPKRKDGEHTVIIDDPSGREEEPVTEEAWRRELDNTLSDDNREPVVFLDDQQKELAVVYIGRGTKIDAKMRGENLLEIAISVPGGKEGRGRRRGMM